MNVTYKYKIINFHSRGRIFERHLPNYHIYKRDTDDCSRTNKGI